jgi:hypothetical protein
MTHRLSKTEIISIYNIEVHFFDELTAAGLLKVEEENDDIYLAFDHLDRLERFANLHYDLDINIPGIEVIDRLLDQMQTLKEENLRLRPLAIYNKRLISSSPQK